MHTDPLEALAQRRDGLSAQMERERGEMAQAAQALADGPATAAGPSPHLKAELAHFMERYGFALLPLAVLLLLNPRRSLRWGLAVWGLWRMVREAGFSEEVVIHLVEKLAHPRAPN